MYTELGFATATGGDRVFRELALARIIVPTSKLDSLRVLDEAGTPQVPSYRTLTRRLPVYAEASWRERLAIAWAGPGHARPVGRDHLYFETDKAEGFGELGFSKELRLEPQITVGMLTDAAGF